MFPFFLFLSKHKPTNNTGLKTTTRTTFGKNLKTFKNPYKINTNKNSLLTTPPLPTTTISPTTTSSSSTTAKFYFDAIFSYYNNTTMFKTNEI